jgi:hypothetical protein
MTTTPRDGVRKLSRRSTLLGLQVLLVRIGTASGGIKAPRATLALVLIAAVSQGQVNVSIPFRSAGSSAARPVKKATRRVRIGIEAHFPLDTYLLAHRSMDANAS